jgi:deoxyinosine 3'endonuclease (endonuclease V)
VVSPFEPVAITDVHYLDSGARAAVVVAERWSDATPREEHVVTIEVVAPWRNGDVARREGTASRCVTS